jgi:hypothetical protein
MNTDYQDTTKNYKRTKYLGKSVSSLNLAGERGSRQLKKDGNMKT